MTSVDLARVRVARAAADRVESGQVIGYGTGRTSALVLEALSQRLKAGTLSDIRGVATSIGTARVAAELGLPLEAENCGLSPDLTIDGADEVDPNLGLVKGGGGALLREKVVAEASRRRIFVIDWVKRVDRLGATRPIPIEVVPAVSAWVRLKVEALGAEVTLRTIETESGRAPFETDNGLFILDAQWSGGVEDPARLAEQLHFIPGLVEHGLFLDLADEILVGTENGDVEILRKT